MPKVEDVNYLNIDGIQYPVEDMSDAVKKMVDIFNDWNLEEAELRQELIKIQSAKNDLSRQIILQVRKDLEPEEEKKDEPEVQINENDNTVAGA